MERNKTVDIMKTIAIIMVVVCHTGQKIKEFPFVFEEMLKIGQLGVQIFFVMTAYLCCATSKGKSYKNYIIGKYLRIAPAYYFGIVLYVFLFKTVVSLNLPIRIYTNVDLPDILLNFSLLNNLVPSACNTVVPGGWSISCIWIFFLVFPFLFKITCEKKGQIIWLLLRMIFYLFVYFMIIKKVFVIENNSFEYFSFYNQCIAFEMGILLYYIENKNINTKWILCTTIVLTWITGYLFYFVGHSISWIAIPIVSSLLTICWYLILKKCDFKSVKNWVTNMSNRTFSIFILHPLFAYYGVSYSYKIMEKFGVSINGIIMFILWLIICLLSCYFIAGKLEKLFNIPIKIYKK